MPALVSTLALVGIVILVSALLSGAVERSGLPQVAIFLLLGAVLGPSGLGVVDVRLDSPALLVITTLALVLVLFSDAISVDVGEIRARKALALIILGPGTLLPAVLIALAAWALLGIGPASAAMIGGALASTDPVLLRSLLRHRALPPATKLALRLESGMNDVVLLPVVVLAMLAARPGGMTGADVGRSVVGLFLLGPALGAGVGFVAITVLARVRAKVGVRRDYESIYALGVALTAFAAAEAVHGSGFLAAFAAGLVVALLDVELCDCFLDYGEATAEMFLLLTFVAFGAALIWEGADVASWRTLLFAAIALSVRTLVLLGVLARAGIPARDRRLIAAFGPRGLSSLLLVLLPVFAGVPGAGYLFAVTSLVVLVSVVVHGGGIAIFLQREVAKEKATALAVPPAPATGAPRGRPLPLAESRALHADNPETASQASAEHQTTISIDDYLALQRAGEPVTLVDARTERVYRPDAVRAAGAVRLPPDDAVRTARALGLAQHGTVVVYCAWKDEATSARVARELRQAGWTRAVALVGGWAAWRERGLPVEDKPAETGAF